VANPLDQQPNIGSAAVSNHLDPI